MIDDCSSTLSGDMNNSFVALGDTITRLLPHATCWDSRLRLRLGLLLSRRPFLTRQGVHYDGIPLRIRGKPGEREDTHVSRAFQRVVNVLLVSSAKKVMLDIYTQWRGLAGVCAW